MKIATWNVNSVKTRLPHLLLFLKEHSPDIVLLQELKTVTESFPAMEVEELGYNLAIHGQKTYNGVAILSKFPLEDVQTTLPGDPEDDQARYIEAVASIPGGALRVASVYVPNGQAVDSDKFVYKMGFLERLHRHLDGLLKLEEMAVIGGDYNVAPEPIDVFDPGRMEGSICYNHFEWDRLRAILNLGWHDAFRLLHPGAEQFSWWDYRAGDFEHNRGMRIDHLLLSPYAADKLAECSVIDSLRKLEKPSDHAPVMCRLAA